MAKADGMNYAPKGKAQPVVPPGAFKFAAMALEHGHINGQCNGLSEAGAELKWIYDADAAKAEKLHARFPNARLARSEQEVLDDPEVKLVAAAAVPNQRGPFGCRVMRAGKDYFTDKTPFTEMAHLEEARRTVAETGKKYMVYYSERLHVEAAVFAGQLVKDGAIGRVVQTLGTGPHRCTPASRPEWFFKKACYGGILCDIGSHQIEQFLYYTGAQDAQVLHSKVANYAFKEYPELEDFGDATLLADNGATGYFRVDWLNPAGLRTWGDGRTVLLGTDGFIEMRKYTDLARDDRGDWLFLVDQKGEREFQLSGQVGFPFFGQLILDCLNRTEHAMTQAHAFKAGELCLLAQQKALRVE